MSVINKPAPQKKVRLTIRLSEDYKQRVRRASAVVGQTMNSFAVSHLLKRANEIIENGEAQSLPKPDPSASHAPLDAAPREN